MLLFAVSFCFIIKNINSTWLTNLFIFLLTNSHNVYIATFCGYKFTMYPAHIRVGRGNLVIRHFFPILHQILEALRVEWRNSTSRYVLTPERTNENIKYLISSRVGVASSFYEYIFNILRNIKN